MSSVASSSVAESGPVAATPGPVAAVPGPIAATPGPPLATASAIAPIDVLADEGTYKLGKATKLMVAAASGSFRTLEKVLRQGARVDIVNEIGFTAMHFAAKAKSDNSAVIKELHSQGLSVNSTSKGQKIDGAPPDGYNPLHLVMNAGSATTFIELGADPNAFGSSIVGVGRGPPVFIAAVNGNATVLKALLSGGGFLAGQYCWWAAQQGKVSTVKAMLEHGHFDLGYVREQDLSQSSSMKGRLLSLRHQKDNHCSSCLLHCERQHALSQELLRDHQDAGGSRCPR